MATNQAMSNTSDWIFQPYQNHFSRTNQIQTSPINTLAAAAADSAAATTSRNNNLSPEQGRVAKPMRRRTRVSRRTPTTLLNTDTSNFRAMVQHFTGGSAASFAAGQQIPAALNYMDHMAAAGFGVQYPNLNQVQQQPPHHMFMMDVNGGGGGGAAAPGSGDMINYDRFVV